MQVIVTYTINISDSHGGNCRRLHHYHILTSLSHTLTAITHLDIYHTPWSKQVKLKQVKLQQVKLTQSYSKWNWSNLTASVIITLRHSVQVLGNVTSVTTPKTGQPVACSQRLAANWLGACNQVGACRSCASTCTVTTSMTIPLRIPLWRPLWLPLWRLELPPSVTCTTPVTVCEL